SWIPKRILENRYASDDELDLNDPHVGITGHFGPERHRFVLAQDHHGQVSVLRLVALLTAIGLAVSKRQSLPR
ncbi:MAG: hypothetical protein ACREFK_20395, partial [Stellaceae bacterium]